MRIASELNRVSPLELQLRREKIAVCFSFGRSQWRFFPLPYLLELLQTKPYLLSNLRDQLHPSKVFTKTKMFCQAKLRLSPTPVLQRTND